MNTTENMTEPPKKQWATSIFHQAALSLPLAIAEALVGTWLAYHSGLPEDIARQLSYAIWGACFVGGTGSTLQASGALPERSQFLTRAKVEVEKAKVLANINPAPVPDAAAPEEDMPSHVPTFEGGDTDDDNAG